MSRKKDLFKLARINAVAQDVSQRVCRFLATAGVQAETRTKQAGTNTIYASILVFQPNGEQLRGCGATIRISDHRQKPADRWVNFSRPARRFYGVWCFTDPQRLDRKARRIGENILKHIGRWQEGGEA